jgi:hypothetical protein
MSRLPVCIALAGMLSACVASFEPLSDDPDLVGTVQWIHIAGDGRFDALVESESQGTHGITAMRFQGSNRTPVLLLTDEGLSTITADSIEVGDAVEGWFGEYIMDSLPPQTAARRLMVVR